MSLRIIAGSLKGRRIDAPPGLDTRPLLDRIKQALFDWLGQDLDGLTVVDACSGSGSFAFEAASRGAALVHACEPGAQAFATLAANHRGLGAPATVRLHRAPFQRVLPTLSGIDLAFCDPPFPWFAEDPGQIAILLELAVAALAPDGAILIRGEQGTSLPVVAGVQEEERRRYGRSWVALLRRR
jgi:16S rRNA (guanine966-N2)-methyltransferase